MNFFERRRWRKAVKRALHESRHVRHTRMDVTAPALIQDVEDAEKRLRDALANRDAKALESSMQLLGERLARISPTHKRSSMRENIEIVVVALGVAMAFRTYFIQPFKIPTGSMQPTLYGIKVDPDAKPSGWDGFPLSVAKRLLMGQRYIEVRAPSSGTITYVVDPSVMQAREYASVTAALAENGDTRSLWLRSVWAWIAGDTPPGPVRAMAVGATVNGPFRYGGKLCCFHRDMKVYVNDGDRVTNGQVIASGLVSAGDHIFVNRLAYNFRKPSRGDVFVFSTRDIKYPQVRTDNYYIKRMVGLPGESIEIREPYLVANGHEVKEPYCFQRQVEGAGYPGYVNPQAYGYASTALGAGRSLKIGSGEYLPMGDNTHSSLDGRYFGPVRQERILGPAFIVYWPFGPRWGRIR